jgi:hypothetical protein
MQMVNNIKKRLAARLRTIATLPERQQERQLILQALVVAKMNRALPRLGNLAEAEFCGFSQWGEDGIIDWLVERLPGLPRTFVEFGVEDYRESNTRLLVCLRNWRGLLMDGSAQHISDIQRQDVYWRYDLTAKCAFIDRDNINQLISDAGFKGDIGLLSVDIDGNDYWVWQAINVISPVIVICEYNAVFGNKYQLTVPYQADFQRTRAHHSNLYFGASFPALERLSKEKGYTFVGTTSTGCNAFFVRNDHAHTIVDALGEILSFPSSVRESRDQDGVLTFQNGQARGKVIADLPLVNVENNQSTTLGELGELCSSNWIV